MSDYQQRAAHVNIPPPRREPPPTPPVGRPQGGILPMPPHVLRAHTEALNQLGAAIRQLAEAIAASFQPPKET